MVSKAVTGYNLEPDRNYTFTIQANASMGTETGALVIENEQIYIKKEKYSTESNFTDNKATFTLKKAKPYRSSVYQPDGTIPYQKRIREAITKQHTR